MKDDRLVPVQTTAVSQYSVVIPNANLTLQNGRRSQGSGNGCIKILQNFTCIITIAISLPHFE